MMKKRMKIMNLRITHIFIALLAMLSVAAQDSVLVKEVTVSQDFNPTVNDAFKISTSPSTDVPVNYSPDFEYSFFNAPLKTDYEISFIEASQFSPKALMPLGNQNYIKGGGGNYSTLLGEIFYNAYNTDKQTLNIFYRNKSSWGDVRLPNDVMVDAPNLSNYGKIDFERRYRKMVLSSAFTFDRLGYKYYGYNTLDNANHTYFYMDDASGVILEDDKQSLTNLNFDINLSSIQRRSSEFKYDANFAFNTISNDDGFSENQFDLGADLEQELDDFILGGRITSFVGFYGKSDPGINRQYQGDTYFGFNIAPYAKLEKKNWDLKVGADIAYYKMDSISEFIVSPIVDFNYNIVPKYFVGYVTAKGNLDANTYRSVAMNNPYVANDIYRQATKNLLDLGAGVVGHPTKELSLKLGVNYKMYKNHLFYVNEFVQDTSSINNAAYTNRFVAEYDDMNVLTFHAEANYNTYENWSVSAAVDIYNYSLDEMPEAWNLPSFKVSAFGHYDINDKIKIKGSFTFLPERAVKVSLDNDVDYLPATYDISIGGEYKFSDNLSFFLDMNNIAASKYYLYNGYPTYRFNVLAGAIFRF